MDIHGGNYISWCDCTERKIKCLMKNRIVKFVVLVCCLCSMPGIVRAQLSVHQFDQLMKKVDDVLWYEKVGDIAHVDKVILCGPPRWKESVSYTHLIRNGPTSE